MKEACVRLMLSLVFLPLAGPHANARTAPSCEEQLARIQDEFYRELELEKLREITRKVQKQAAAAETAEFASLSERFHSLSPELPGGIDEMITLQNKAKLLTRAIVRRARYPVLNPETGTPYDALISRQYTPDGFLESATEVRGLLILRDPLPHVTFWMHTDNPAHNPRLIINLGIMKDRPRDYASWTSPENYARVSGSMLDFLKTFLPASCR